MSLIPDSLIQQIRTTVDEPTMADTLFLDTLISTSDGAGGTTESTTSAPVPCRFVASGTQQRYGDRVIITTTDRFYVPLSTTIPANARITYRGRTYRIITPVQINAYSTSQRIDVEQA